MAERVPRANGNRATPTSAEAGASRRPPPGAVSGRGARRNGAPPPAASREGGALSRTSRLLRFALRYRHVGTTPPRSDAVPVSADPGHDIDADAFVHDLQHLGPAFVKIGQSLSTRADLLPPSYLDALERLQDDVGPVPFETIRASIERELGVRLSKAFAEFDPEPLATASLAQVHAAVLRDGREVVVKVQRPGIADAIADDLKVLSNLAGAADRWTEQGRRARFGHWLEELAETLAEELDYRLELENLRTFAGHVADYAGIIVPEPVADLSSARVLTMERIRGSKVNQAVALRRIDQPLGALAVELLHAYLDQIFVNGLVHADPHPGNVMLTDDNRLGLIDLGMVVRIGPRMRDGLLKLLFALVQGDGDQVAEQCMELGERLEMFNETRWRRRCARLVGRYGSGAQIEPEGRLMLELTRLSIDCGLRPPPEIALLGKTLLHLDAVARMLDPALPVRDIVRERMISLLPTRLLGKATPLQAVEQAFETAELARDLPRKLRTVLNTLAENQFSVRICGLEESRLLENLQKIANRITTGVITAALIIGAALMMRIPVGPSLLGYPALALVMFIAAFALGVAVVLAALRSDRRASKYSGRR